MLVRRGSMSAAEIVVRAHMTLGGSQEKFGERFGASRRTVTRWVSGQSTPSESDVVTMAHLVYPHDAALAARIAEAVGGTLVSLGIEPPPPSPAMVEPAPVAQPPPPPAKTLSAAQLVDGIVCAAAEAMDLSPRALRPALFAAFRKARELGVALEEAEEALAPAGAASARPAS
jgi:transcriptional regulator with XRE-family HTH domain